MLDQRWIMVADSPFLPAMNGGQQEHRGFAVAAAQRGLLALLVLPDGDTVDLQHYSDLLGGVPVLGTPRSTQPWRLAHPRLPFVVASRPVPKDLVQRAAQAAPDATGIVVYSYKSRALGQSLAQGLHLPTVIRQHNREGAYHRALASQTPGPRGWVYRWEAAKIERDERELSTATWLSGTADISAADATWRRSTGARNVIHVPPFARTLASEPTTAAAPNADPNANPDLQPNVERNVPLVADRVPGADRVVFVGSLDVATNVGALEWFLNGVWPEILQNSPDAVLDVIGRRPSADLAARLARTPRAQLLADVPAIGPYLARAKVGVNPVVSGSGVNIKLVDYLDAGLPLVSTSLATRGLPLRAGVDLEVHDEPTAFAAAVSSLLADPDKAALMAASGRAQIAELLDPDRNLDLIAGLLNASA